MLRYTKGHRAALLLAITVALFAAASFPAYAAYNASDLLGQLESDLPYYTVGTANDVVNPRGFDQAIGVALDTVHHRLFVADQANSRVLVYNLNASNILVDRVADNVLGQPDMKTNASTTSQTGMRRPRSLFYDATNDRLFVGDRFNHRVLIFNFSSGITNGMAASFVLGQTDFTSMATATTATGMQFPSDSLFDPATNRLFITDTNNNRLLIFDVSGGITNGMAAAYVLGQTSFTSSTAVTATTSLRNPAQMAYDSVLQRLFVADASSNRVVIYDLAGGVTSTMNASFVLGQTTFTGSGSGITTSTMNFPSGLVYDAANTRLFVGEFTNNRITVFNVASGTLANGMNPSFVLGQSAFNVNTATTTQYAARTVGALAYDPATGLLYGAESSNNRLVIFDVASITNGENAVNALGQLNGDDTPHYTKSTANNAPFNRGFNVQNYSAVDTVRHRLFANDFTNHRVLVFNLDSSNNLVDHVADYVLGQTDFRNNTAAGSTSTFINPQGMSYDSANDRLFVADINNNRVLVFDLSGGITNGMNANFVLGQANFTAQVATTTQTGMTTPYDVEYESKNNRLFVVDNVNHRVLVFDLSSGITNGMAASYVLGQPDFTTKTTGTSQSKFNTPEQLAYDSVNERLFVAEFQNKRVLAFDVNPATITNGEDALFVLGQPDFTSNSSLTTQSGMAGATGVVYDAANMRLFTSDYINNRVLAFDVNPATVTSSINAAGVLGQTSFTTANSATTRSGFVNPWGLAYDSGNRRLYVSDVGNNRVMIFTLFNISTPSLPSGLTDEAYSQTLSASNAPGTLSWSVASGTLPPGLTFSSSGVLSGRPTPGTSGSYTFTVQATDVAGGSLLYDRKSYTVNIGMPAGGSTTVTPPPAASGGGTGNTTSTTAVATSTASSTPPSGSATSTTALQAQIAQLLALLRDLQIKAGILPVAPAPTKTLSLGMQGPVVKQLQAWLNQNGFPLAQTGPGSPGQETDRFGALTWKAVARFQEAYASEVLVPVGLSRGSGIVGPRTWAKLGELGF